MMSLVLATYIISNKIHPVFAYVFKIDKLVQMILRGFNNITLELTKDFITFL